jgi:DNA-binding protein YbaB
MSEESARHDLDNVNRIVEDAEEAMRTIQQAQAKMAELTGEGCSDDSLVQALTDAEGQLESITVNPRIMRLGCEAIERAVTTAVQRAQQNAKEKSERLLGDVLGSVQPLDASFVDERIAKVMDDLARHD